MFAPDFHGGFRLDTAIGEVANCFAAKGMADNLLTIFTTDNGGPVGSDTNGHPTGIGDATGSQNWPLRGGKGAYFQGGVRGTAWVHGAMLHPSVVGTTSFELMHVTDILPTIVEAAGGDAAASAPAGHPLDGVSQWGVLTDGATGPRTDVLINIERENPTTAAHDPNKPGQGCNGEAQYVVIKGAHKLIVGGGGQYGNLGITLDRGACSASHARPPVLHGTTNHARVQLLPHHCTLCREVPHANTPSAARPGDESCMYGRVIWALSHC